MLFSKKQCGGEVMIYFIGVYFDALGTVIMIGNTTYNNGPRIDCGSPVILQPGYSAEDLGNGVKEIIKKEPYFTSADVDLKNPVYFKASGIKSYSKFSKKHKLITIRWDDENNDIRFEFWRLLPRNQGYEPDFEAVTPQTLPLQSSALELGSCLSKMMEEINGL